MGRRKNSVLVQEGSCWLWQGRLHKNGYAAIYLGGKEYPAHRLIYTIFVGPVPKVYHMDHLCRVRHCVNPAHLEPVTPRINTLRGHAPAAVNAKKTHCHRGHPFSAENTYRNKNRRCCRICRELYHIMWREKRNQAKSMS